MNIICDLDGTIALDHMRAAHLHGNRKCPKYLDSGNNSLICICEPTDRNWDAYFDACDTDEPNHAVIELLNGMSKMGHDTTILSGRSISTSEKTLAWLKKYKVDYEYLQMRSVDSREADDVMKLRWAADLNLTPANTLFVLEDRTRVVNAWRAKGFRCFQVAPGNF